MQYERHALPPQLILLSPQQSRQAAPRALSATLLPTTRLTPGRASVPLLPLSPLPLPLLPPLLLFGSVKGVRVVIATATTITVPSSRRGGVLLVLRQWSVW
mgnify:CR=1 FL=1